jgi:hypothetical protein
MEKITFAPAYVAFYPMLAEIARDHGYSLAIHGSVGKKQSSDFDLVAIPWIDDAKSVEELMAAIEKYSVTCINEKWIGDGLIPETRPHGRNAYKIQLGNGAAIDISVMPRMVK